MDINFSEIDLKKLLIEGINKQQQEHKRNSCNIVTITKYKKLHNLYYTRTKIITQKK